MNKKHDALFDDVLKGLDTDPGEVEAERGQTRFLKRSTAMSEQVAGARQEKVMRLVDPATCVMWAGHNRAYDLLTPDNCADLIEGLKAQGQQEFPAIVRRLDGDGAEFEVICGARRHFAVSWLRANNYPQFRYLIEERVLTDEEAFRLADIENRDREDISDYERARDYARAVDAYYGGKQTLMADRLQVSPGFLSRFLQLARLEPEIVAAFPGIRDIKELHARQLRPLMAEAEAHSRVIAAARAIAESGEGLTAAEVVNRLKAAGKPPVRRKALDTYYKHPDGNVRLCKKGAVVALEFQQALSERALRSAVDAYLKDRKAK
ncbi:chromosome partitioning protein, ParB family [Loktanella fryxellensis]|uniref:Chromosome partitioning protein, ParB family n=1 Tax=Loktanella fryxellensis TaxID=245187 RepID=A0A1H8HD56_9RHOB|nr:ParB/RepB/Spo0J family partition protein [Loktanella fryxellensis]SEN53914.1 chromosome partitioning protein, ParB family [Loktanella fryxellensis]